MNPNEEIVNLLRRLSPAEILYLKDPYKIDILSLIEFTFLDLWISDKIIIEKKAAKFCKSGNTLFIKLHKNLHLYNNFSSHEMILVNQLVSDKWVSFLEFGGFIANFLDHTYTAFSCKFNFEKYVLTSLFHNKLISRHKIIAVNFLKLLRKFPYSEEGNKVHKELIRHKDIFLSFEQLKIFQFGDNIRAEKFLKSEFYAEIVKELNEKIERQLNHRMYGTMAIAEWGKRYPIPVDE